MHSRKYLAGGGFQFISRARTWSFAEAVPGWTSRDRVAIVTLDPERDLPALGGLVLALTHAFYDRPEAHAAGFFDYPSHFIVAGEAGSAPHILGPSDARPWGRAWCWLDVWPATHQAVSDLAPAALLRALLLLEPTRILWPERVPWPARGAADRGPPFARDESARHFLRSRVRQVLTYGPSERGAARPDAWSVQLVGGARQLLDEAGALLPGTAQPRQRDPTWFRSLPLEDWLIGSAHPGDEGDRSAPGATTALQ